MVESKLLKLLAPLEKDDQSLMKLDAIFAALHVDNEDDVYRLANYFIQHRMDEGVTGGITVTQGDKDEQPEVSS